MFNYENEALRVIRGPFRVAGLLMSRDKGRFKYFMAQSVVWKFNFLNALQPRKARLVFFLLYRDGVVYIWGKSGRKW